MSEFFAYKSSQLHVENVPVPSIASAVGTPFYVYSAGAFESRYRRLAAAFEPDLRPLICFAAKANSNLAVLRLFAGFGAGADVVSEGEMRRALAAGVPARRIIFSGVGKTRAEHAAALDAEIHQFNIESVPELRQLSEVAAASGRTARVAIRVNPDVDAQTHAKIATGLRENKFGIDFEEAVSAYAMAARLPGIEPVGLAVHIGSQLTDLEPFGRAFTRLAGIVGELRARNLPVRSIDLGGGLGIRYRGETEPDPAAYAGLVRQIFGPLDIALVCEPGRFLAGPAGLLVARVLYVKEGTTRRFVILDAAMNDLIRPALYEAWHDIVPVRAPRSGTLVIPADVVGPVCETGDTFAVGRNLPPLSEGDLVALTAAGAYGAVMSSTYNSRPLVPEVLVADGRFAVIRERQSIDALLALDKFPPWLPDRSGEPPGPGGAA
ncbi:MAG: diaminopimelate decarboxylase [Alphaproteobacteria bacterium]|nr:diaminopimelate decarboxylase [Alphaproteobacteria bacterium]MBV9862129.1 diaminopimelate decarboxylase [Alphaproteobacteria bacterium]